MNVIFGSTSYSFLSLWLADVLEEVFGEIVFIFNVGVGCSVGEVFLTAFAGEISALRVLALSAGRFG